MVDATGSDSDLQVALFVIRIPVSSATNSERRKIDSDNLLSPARCIITDDRGCRRRCLGRRGTGESHERLPAFKQERVLWDARQSSNIATGVSTHSQLKLAEGRKR